MSVPVSPLEDEKEYKSFEEFRKDFPGVYLKGLSSVKIEGSVEDGDDMDEIGSELLHSFIFRHAMGVSTETWMPVSSLPGFSDPNTKYVKCVELIPIRRANSCEREEYSEWIPHFLGAPQYEGCNDIHVLRTFGPSGTNRYVVCAIEMMGADLEEGEDYIIEDGKRVLVKVATTESACVASLARVWDLHGDSACDCADLEEYCKYHVASIKFTVCTPKTGPFMRMIHEQPCM